MAPYSWALRVEADIGHRGDGHDDLDEPDTSGRLILLHDPAGQDRWAGTFRFVCFVQARLEPEQLDDELLPVVGWSWLTDALAQSGAAHVALGGTVTQTSSVRFGDIAGPRCDDVEIRASWTPEDDPADLGRHAEAFFALITSAAGLPPVDVRTLTPRSG
ncbi:membrane protein [Pseudonocardia asaccharolytica DSM 44247 = NBRC 16224]|uniref:Membrane protein n=2 Tax=Pseudonocardia asaccharolytica TaxID=54010 RepID=A0A511CZA8_9PSEU|nr:membrane protein [Pseudonocardia asaccharolytica DSM 44247 = NBRC 16224]